MKKQTKEKVLVEKVVKTEYFCDRCEKKILKDNWFDRFKCEVIIDHGEVYPEGGTIHRQSLVICKDCSNKLINILENNDFCFVEETVDYG